MIFPDNLTNHNRNNTQLQELILWAILAAGKNGMQMAKRLNSILFETNNTWAFMPFWSIRDRIFRYHDLPELLKKHGVGCYNNKAKSWIALIDRKFDLRTCTVDDLESVYGIGPKTARMFVMHSRPNQRFACLDRHILSFLRDEGYDVPKSTPTGKRYKVVEKMFLQVADDMGEEPCDLDLKLWNKYRKK